VSLLIHLTSSASNLETILSEGRLRAMRPFGAAYGVEVLASSQSVVCFSEMAALSSVAELAQRHGAYGVGFVGSWLQKRGAAPVWYLPRGSQVQVELFETIRERAYRRRAEPQDPIWALTPFIDYPRTEPDPASTARYDWRWEREWRVRGDVTFAGRHVAAVFAPAGEHSSTATFWIDRILGGNGWLPPLLDPSWSHEQQEQALRDGKTLVETVIDEDPDSWGALQHGATAGIGDWATDDELQQRELQEELNGWLDEMARDDI
jgi:hypothetical protein